MKIVVVIPVYAQVTRKELTEALESTLNQKTDFEYSTFVVKDGPVSPDLDMVIGEYADKLRVIGRPENLGLASILNYSLKHIEWDFYFRMDADDIMSPGRLQAQVDFLCENPHFHAVGTQFERFIENGEVFKGRVIPQTLEGIRITAIFRSPTAHATMLFKKSFFDLNGFYREELRYGCEDYDLFARAVTNGVNFTSVGSSLYLVRSSVEIQARRLKFQNIFDDFGISFNYVIKNRYYIYIIPVCLKVLVKLILRMIPPSFFQIIKDKIIK